MSFLLQILISFTQVLMWLMLARAITSWFIRDLSNPVIRFLHEITEPIIQPIRNFLQSKNIGGGTFDFSFIIVYFLIMLVQQTLVSFL